MNPALTQRLVSIAAAADAAGHGEKEAVYRAACEELQMSRATLLKKLKGVRMSRPRKQRSDAGKTTLTHDEMLTISGAWLASPRPGNGKKGYSLEDIVDGLRDNGLIIAGRTDTETGEFSRSQLTLSVAPSASIVCTPTSYGHHLLHWSWPVCIQTTSGNWMRPSACCITSKIRPKGQRGHRSARHERGRVQQKQTPQP